MLEKLATQSAYKVFALTGLLLVVITPYVAWQYVTKLEDKAVSIFEQSILTRLDQESLQEQYQSIQNAISASLDRTDSNEAVNYSASELEYLRAESYNLTTQIESLAIDAGTFAAAKKAIIKEIKIAFVLSFVIMLCSMLLAAFGFLGWYFHIRIYQERRSDFGEGRFTDR